VSTLLKSRSQASIRRHLAAGAGAVGLLVFGLGAWASVTSIAGAVIASGSIVVETHLKKVQHPTGGIVGELHVSEGDRVQQGDLLVRLDETLTRANLSIVSKALNELTARQARLEAERDAAAEIKFPADLLARAVHEDVHRLLDGERRMFITRRTASDGRKSQLKERIAQLEEEIEGLEVRQRAKAREIELIARELKGAKELWSKGLYQITKLTALEREATRVEGERGQLMNLIAEAKGKISEVSLAILQIDHDQNSEVGKELREIEGKIGELTERKVAAEDLLKRVEIRAPYTGFVQQLAVHTVGGVIAPGDTIMLIVPDNDELGVDVKVLPHDIDQLHMGQPAALRLSALNQRTTPEIGGTISRISADAQTDVRTGANYYSVRIAIPAAERARLGAVKLIPGMPVEAFIATADRTVISYLMKPLTDQAQRAFRED
jgi:HlyD family secretion protein